MPSKMGHKIICISIGNSQNNVLNKIIEKQTMTSEVNSKENNNDNSQVSLSLNKVYFTAMPILAFYSNQWLFICYKLIYISYANDWLYIFIHSTAVAEFISKLYLIIFSLVLCLIAKWSVQTKQDLAWVLTDSITITVWNYRTRRYQLIKFSQHKITSKNISKPSTHIESIENNESIKRTKCFLTSFHELSAPNCSFGTKNMVCFIEKRMDGSFLINLRNDKKWISFW